MPLPAWLPAMLAPLLPAQEPAPTQPELVLPALPGEVVLDRFHPDASSPAEPRHGGSVTLHLAGRPSTLNYMLGGSALTRQLLLELHEPLIRRDQETWAWRGVLARYWEASEDGLVWTFGLRDDVRWHDGHPFDARDVVFTYSLWKNPGVDCDRRRYMFDKLAACERLDDYTVRFTFAEPYFMAASSFDESFTILPAHRFDLSDPDNPDRVEGSVDPERQAEYVNEHPGNLDWVGLGPYRLASSDAQGFEARRFEGYFDPGDGGWLDTIRWRVIADSGTAMQALLAGELDFYDRLSIEDYLGGRTDSAEFRERLYKGHFFTPYMAFTAWNLRRPELEDARVRRALAMAFDFDAYVRDYYRGLALRVTGDQWFPTPWYDRALEPLAYDPRAAADLLAEAGWYDRDGDGLVDRDGAPLEIELLMQAGNAVTLAFSQLYQEALRRVGVRVELTALELAALRERVVERDYDGVNLGLVLAFESDPEQLWHSRWAEGPSSNRSGLADPVVDGLIEAIQVELDDGARAELFHELQAEVHARQPYLFRVTAPHRFALSRRVRGVGLFALDPGYSVRRWYVTDAE